MRENKDGGKKSKKVRYKVAADPSASCHGHFHFHRAVKLPPSLQQAQGERKKKQQRWTKSGKRLTRLNKSVGSSGETGAQRCLRG